MLIRRLRRVSFNTAAPLTLNVDVCFGNSISKREDCAANAIMNLQN